MANELGRLSMEIQAFQPWLVITWCNTSVGADANSLEKVARAGERLVCHLQSPRVRYALSKSRSLGVERKVCGKLHLKLNICLRPTANKYYEGKTQRILKRKLQVLGIAGREVSWTSFAWWDWRVALAFMSVSALLLALSVRTSSFVN